MLSVSRIFAFACLIAGVGCTTIDDRSYDAVVEIEEDSTGFIVRMTNAHDHRLCVSSGTLPGPDGYVGHSSDAPELLYDGVKYSYKKTWSGYFYQTRPQHFAPDETKVFHLSRSDFEAAPDGAILKFNPVLTSCRNF